MEIRTCLAVKRDRIDYSKIIAVAPNQFDLCKFDQFVSYSLKLSFLNVRKFFFRFQWDFQV